MSKKILLERWQAAELYCRAIDKYLKTKSDRADKYDPNEPVLSNKKLDRSDKLLLEDWPIILAATGIYLRQAHGTALTELRRKIHSYHPVLMSLEVIKVLDAYVAKPGEVLPIRLPHNADGPGKATEDFENKAWWVYYYEARQKAEGVVRATLLFKPFGGAEIQSLIKGVNKVETYIGHYSLLDNEKFISLEMKLTPYYKKDLHIKLYTGGIGANDLGLSLGMYTNYENSIYAGSMMLEPIVDVSNEVLNPIFFRRNSSRLEDHVWRFFKDGEQSTMSIDGNVTSIETFNIHYPPEEDES